MAYPDILRDLDIARAFVCPHWPYWERHGDPALKRPDDEAGADDLFERLWNERALVERLAPGAVWVSASDETEAAAETLRLMRAGADAIANPCLRAGDRLGRPSLLRRQTETSRFGTYSYAPIDIRRGIGLSKSELFRLYFYGELLETLQGSFPVPLLCANRDGAVFTAVPDERFIEYQDFVARLRKTIDGECPPPVYRKGCEDTSPWGDACLRLAREHDDVALLFSVSQKQLAGLRAQGIETVRQAAEMDPERLDGTEPGLTRRALQRLQRQARSLLDRSIAVRAPWPELGTTSGVFFDIESHPGTDQDYLYGFVIRGEDGSEEARTLSTFDGSSEADLWRTLLALVKTLPPDVPVYHYGEYEPLRLATLATRYGTVDPALDAFRARLTDMKDLVRDTLVLPLYFYSLKAVASFLGYRWHGGVRHGRDSVELYEAWLKTRDPEAVERLVRYNADDVRGLAHAVAWAERWARQETTYLPPYPWERPSATLEP